jgi:hypothetical protein
VQQAATAPVQVAPWTVQLPPGRQVPSPQKNPAQHCPLAVQVAGF